METLKQWRVPPLPVAKVAAGMSRGYTCGGTLKLKNAAISNVSNSFQEDGKADRCFLIVNVNDMILIKVIPSLDGNTRMYSGRR